MKAKARCDFWGGISTILCVLQPNLNLTLIFFSITFVSRDVSVNLTPCVTAFPGIYVPKK